MFNKYTSVDAAVGVIMQLGRGTQLIKIDLQDAYRMAPNHPHDQTLLGVRWLYQTIDCLTNLHLLIN